MIKSVKLMNFLSFGADSQEVELHALNILIGRNGSGKTNFLEAVDLIRNAPSEITTPIREGGGVSEWLFKDENLNPAIIELEIENHAAVSKAKFPSLLYQIKFAAEGQRFTILDEKITSTHCKPDHDQLYIFYNYNNGHPVINVKSKANDGSFTQRRLSRGDISPEQSILKQRRDPESYPEITSLANKLTTIKSYRECSFGRGTSIRKPTSTNSATDFLAEDYSNLPLILNQLEYMGCKPMLLEKLKLFYSDVEDFVVRLDGGTAQLFFRESGLKGLVPVTRLSDGTLRYLFLLSVLLHPEPPPLICIDEPELGLHPDILPSIGRLLEEASEHCQLIVTTHSPALINSVSHIPDCVLVTEKEDMKTKISRLDKDELAPWLQRYQLGELWTRGDIGGNIW